MGVTFLLLNGICRFLLQYPNVVLEASHEQKNNQTILNNNMAVWSPAMKLLFHDEDEVKLLETILRQIPDSISQRTCTGSSLLHCCSLSDKPKSMAYLIMNGCNVNIKNDFEETPLHWIAKSGATDSCKLLIVQGANINSEDSDGNTPLHWACEYDNIDIIKILLQSKNLDLNVKNYEGYTPLEIAAMNGNYETVKLLTTCRKNLEIDQKNLRKCAKFGENDQVIKHISFLFSKECFIAIPFRKKFEKYNLIL